MMRDLLDMTADFVKRIAQIYTDDYMIWANMLRQFVYILCMLAILPLMIITMSFGFYTEREKSEATGLRKLFELFGKRSNTKESDSDYE